MANAKQLCAGILCAMTLSVSTINYKDALAGGGSQTTFKRPTTVMLRLTIDGKPVVDSQVHSIILNKLKEHYGHGHRMNIAPRNTSLGYRPTGNHHSRPGGMSRVIVDDRPVVDSAYPSVIFEAVENNMGKRIVVEPRENWEISLPNTLKKTSDKITIHHFRSNQQKGLTCGNHAVFNAVAIQELVEEGKSLDGKVVADRAALYHPNIKSLSEMLSYEDIIYLGINLQLKNAHVLAYNSEKDRYYTAGEIRAPKEVDAFFDQIRNASKISAHFIFHTPGHWTTVSVVKKDGKYQVIHLNSTNAKVRKNGQIYNFLQEIYARLS